MFRLTRLFNEDANIQFVLESADVCCSDFLQELDIGQPKLRGRTRRRCHGFCDGTRRHSNNRGHPTDLPNGKGCSFEHPKIRSHGGRPEGYIDEHAEHPILSGNNHSGFQFHEYGCPFRECHLVEGDRKVKALARDVYVFHLCIQRFQYVHTFLLSKICHSTEFSDPEGTRATTFTDNIRVYMEWCDHQFAPTNLTTPGGGRRYGLDRCHSQTPCPLF